MPRSHWKDIPIQIGLTAEALHRLRQVVLDVEDSVAHEGVLKHSHLVHWAAHYLIVADREDVIRILEAGKSSQEAYETRAERQAVEAGEEESAPPEPTPQEAPPEPPSSPVGKTTATVWTRGKKPRKGDGKGLDSERPTGRKMRKSPPRK